MFEFLRRMSAAKLSAVVIRWLFYCGRCFGILCFRFRNPTKDQVVMEEYGPWWKWIQGIFRIGCLGMLSRPYLGVIVASNDLLRSFLHILRLLLNIAGTLSLLRLLLFQGTECTQLVNRFVHIFQKVRCFCKQNPNGFGGAHELVLLILSQLCLIYEGYFLTSIFIVKLTSINALILMSEGIISFDSRILLLIAVVGYLTLGLLYADLNDYVRTELRSQLESLEEQPTRRKLRKARKSFHTCLALYKDLQSLTSQFQRITDLPLLLSLIRNCIHLAMISYNTYIRLELSVLLHWSLIPFEFSGILLLTMSVQRALLQFGVIHQLMLKNSYLNDNKEWHRTLEDFFTHLNLYEFRVRPLGLFNISNELLVIMVSALVTYITLFIQYGMQTEALSLSIPYRLVYSPT